MDPPFLLDDDEFEQIQIDCFNIRRAKNPNYTVDQLMKNYIHSSHDKAVKLQIVLMMELMGLREELN